MIHYAKNLCLSDIDSFLAMQEQQYSDIVAGTEKKVLWFDGQQQSDIALVYLHGFSASSKEICPVLENLSQRLAANVFFTRFNGHGRSAEALGQASMEDWLTDTREAWHIGQIIGKKVVIIGVSTGATLASWLAAEIATKEEAKTLAANILISPNFGIASRSGEFARWDLGLKLIKLVNGPVREFQPVSELHKQYWTKNYPFEALVPMLCTVDKVVSQDFSRIETPHLIVYSPDDEVIRVDQIKEVIKRMSAAKITEVPFSQSQDPSQHVLAGDACSPNSTEAMVDLLEEYVTIDNPF